MRKTVIAGLTIFFMLTSMTMSAFASWHWSSPWEVCGTEVIKKGEKCELKTNEKNVISEKQTYQIDNSEKNCKEGLQPIKKVTTNTINCVKESSYEKLIQRGWGISI